MTLPSFNPPQPDTDHAVSRLRTSRLAASSKPYVARGAGLVRCAGCRLIVSHCICDLRPSVPTRVGVCLLMGDIEALKPSNTGWLIADVVADTWAFGWARTAVAPELLTLLADPQWQPYVVFPAEYAEAQQRVVTEVPAAAQGDGSGGKRPLFVLLDGTWSEARKMFRKSPYLDRLPVLSLHPEQVSSYRLRRSTQEHHFCTAEVAALCLALAGETRAAESLVAWFDVFSERYLCIREQLPLKPDSEAHQRLAQLAERTAGADALQVPQNVR
ncbi:tRNA-uridine aminocarboxypropyltransferase [Hydrogenophaga sp. A37]|uniref:tRNA-uridine aminocarboxypropyltransferase n=1 Tax=Hydrogenophaga sp. A37 TaxID=1945864 RepID=UPI0009868946|nr:tRNA-uridine aminocarboxypropyltransferase [Hydrogenophaga sp. A37]OOG79471.1 DTW domain-containing protein [Hydrogenophaga sp. A37]